MKSLKYFKGLMRFQQVPIAEKQVCFYSEGPNYWPHLQPILDELLKQHDGPIHFVTSSFDDPVLSVEDPKLHTYVIGEGFVRNYFFERLACGLMIMTMPDLDQYQVKKSSQVGRFIYVHHSMVSHHMVYRPKAFDAFDVICCCGPYHKAELREMSEKWGMPDKVMIEHGYGRLDAIIKEQSPDREQEKTLLLAPSWGPNGSLELMGEALVDALMATGHNVIVRPHPQTLKMAPKVIQAIRQKHDQNPRFTFESGVASTASLHASDLMVSDWSGAALDYAFGLTKPVLFLDVPKKIQNPDYEQLQTEPFEAMIRSEIGVIQGMDMKGLEQNINQLLGGRTDWVERISSLRDQHVYHLGDSGKQAAGQILELL